MRTLRHFCFFMLGLAGCSSGTAQEPVVGSGANTSGSTAVSGAASTGASSTGASGDSIGTTGTAATMSGSTAPSGQVSQGTDASMMSGAMSGSSTGMTSGSLASVPEAGPDTGGAMTDASGMSGPFPSGPSAGCGLPPPVSAGLTNMKMQTISVPSCAAGSSVTPACVSPAFSPGGADYLKVQQWDFNNRNFGLELPAGYVATKSYPVILSGGGCTGGPTTLGGFTAGEGTSAIRVGLSYVDSCFADGGVGGNTGFGCSIDEAHITDCINTPEVPYVNAVLDYIESHLCVDLGKIYIGGLSSGAWEASTLSCALANRIRGMTTVAGGLRINRPVCAGPTAAYMIADGGDNDNPIGPMVSGQGLPAVGLSASQVTDKITMLDSHGSAPMRDELLTRNGCVGTATAVYPGYPQCMTYTGCPAAYPVVWCFMPGEGHGGSFYQNVNYGPGAWTFFSQLPAP